MATPSPQCADPVPPNVKLVVQPLSANADKLQENRMTESFLRFLKDLWEIHGSLEVGFRKKNSVDMSRMSAESKHCENTPMRNVRSLSANLSEICSISKCLSNCANSKEADGLFKPMGSQIQNCCWTFPRTTICALPAPSQRIIPYSRIEHTCELNTTLVLSGLE